MKLARSAFGGALLGALSTLLGSACGVPVGSDCDKCAPAEDIHFAAGTYAPAPNFAMVSGAAPHPDGTTLDQDYRLELSPDGTRITERYTRDRRQVVTVYEVRARKRHRVW
ncbi:MAG TPA: hypothetical protein VFO83_16015 [Aggregicoccus sp.]|nr:hypothetical protein [Aggregicoccus sp.]